MVSHQSPPFRSFRLIPRSCRFYRILPVQKSGLRSPILADASHLRAYLAMPLPRSLVQIGILLALAVPGGGRRSRASTAPPELPCLPDPSSGPAKRWSVSMLRLRGGFQARWGTQHMTGLTTKRPKVIAQRCSHHLRVSMRFIPACRCPRAPEIDFMNLCMHRLARYRRHKLRRISRMILRSSSSSGAAFLTRCSPLPPLTPLSSCGLRDD